MSRSHSVASLMYCHFQWKEDALIVTLPRHKGDQDGAKIFPVHVYANPLMPEICPVLSLAIYAFCNQCHREDNGSNWKLFIGNKVEAKYSNWLSENMKSGKLNEVEIGNSAEDMGTHSFR